MSENCRICELKSTKPDAYEKIAELSVDGGKPTMSDINLINAKFNLRLEKEDIELHFHHDFDPQKLSKQERYFIDKYCTSFNATKAFKEAFEYYEKDAEEKGKELRNDPRIIPKILNELENKKDLVNVSRDEIVAHLFEIWGYALDGEPIFNPVTGEETDHWRIQGGVARDCLESIARIKGFFDKPGLDPETENLRIQLLQDLRERRITATDTALQFTIHGIPLPEVVRILVLKESFGTWSDILEAILDKSEFRKPAIN